MMFINKKIFLFIIVISNLSAMDLGYINGNVEAIHRMMQLNISMGNALVSVAMEMSERDPEQANNIFSRAIEIQETYNPNLEMPWPEFAYIFKAKLLFNCNGIERDRNGAFKILRECFSKYRNPSAMLTLGDLYEKSPDIGNYFYLAATCYKLGNSQNSTRKPEDDRFMCGYRYARLLYLDKIKHTQSDQLQELLGYVRPMSYNINMDPIKSSMFIDAFVLYVDILSDNTNYYSDNSITDEFIKFGIPLMHFCASSGDASSMHQLGVLYRHGLYVDKDIEKAKSYFENALNSDDTQANLVTKAYMYIRGDGVTIDKKKGVELLFRAKSGPSDITDVMINFEQDILGVINSDTINKEPIAESSIPIDAVYTEHVAAPSNSIDTETIIDKPEVISKPANSVNIKGKKPNKRRTNKVDQVPTATPSNKLPAILPYKTIIDKCNELSIRIDKSYIEFDSKKSSFIIHDIKYGKVFEFPVDDGELHSYVTYPKHLTYDNRVKEQQKGNKGPECADPHKFSIAIDLLMQYFWVSSPFKGKSNKDKQWLHAAVWRNEKQKGIFEYTFSGSENILYHRMFRKTGDVGVTFMQKVTGKNLKNKI